MHKLAQAPDGSTKVRSVALEPHVDQLVFEHMTRLGLPNISAALRDLVDRGLATTGALSGPGSDQRSRAYREASRKIENEIREVVREAVTRYTREQGAAAPARGVERGRRVERSVR